MPRLLLFLAVLAAATGCATAQTGELPLTFADGQRAWTVLADGGGQVSWSGSGPATEVSLAPGAGQAGIVARLEPEPTGLVDIGVSATGEGAPQLVVQFLREPTTKSAATLWRMAVPPGKRQRLAARLAPPAAGSQPLYLYIGAQAQGQLRLSELALVQETLPLPADTSVKPALPDGWKPDGPLDAQAREIAGVTELTVDVGGTQVSVNPETSCALGGFASLSALVLARGTGTRMLSITGEFPDGVACDAREYAIAKSGLHNASLRVQGLLPGAYSGRLTASSGKDSASFPIHLTVSRNYPAFGVTAGDTPGARQWQLREVLVRATVTSTAQQLLDQVRPIIEGPPTIPVVFFEGLPENGVLREFVTALKGKVGLYSAAWRPGRPYQSNAFQEEAEALLAVSRELHSVVSTADLDAACISPVFDCTANAEGTPENRLLDACLALKMDKYFGAVVVRATPLPVGGVLGESLNDKNAREPSAFWADLDPQQYPRTVEALMEKHDASQPILTSGIGGPASTDERLDAVKVARSMCLAAYAGATGATFPGGPEAGRIALTRADGALSPAGLAVRELSRELAGAAPILRSWTSSEISGRFGEAIVALPFVRGDEVILVLWNNTSTAKLLTLTLRQVPYSEHVLAVSRDDPLISRTYEGHFEFTKRAVQAKRQEVYVRLAPLQVQVLRYRMQIAIPTWLDGLTYTVQPKGGPPKPDRDDRPWWKKLQDWAEGTE
ncbi:MAG: hypothetical protein FJX75_04145 [Armatimonadetes bacterium]|nr:hypothetical protein [Armatimonadota bacterium]